MTIVFQGHIESVKRHRDKRVAVHVITQQDVCPEGMTLLVPESDAGHWLVGRQVQITAYAVEPPP